MCPVVDRARLAGIASEGVSAKACWRTVVGLVPPGHEEQPTSAELSKLERHRHTVDEGLELRLGGDRARSRIRSVGLRG